MEGGAGRARGRQGRRQAGREGGKQAGMEGWEGGREREGGAHREASRAAALQTLRSLGVLEHLLLDQLHPVKGERRRDGAPPVLRRVSTSLPISSSPTTEEGCTHIGGHTCASVAPVMVTMRLGAWHMEGGVSAWQR